MRISKIDVIGDWNFVKEVARNTVNMEGVGLEPTSEWKTKMIMAEHSPTRHMKVRWKWEEIPYFVSTHFVRHKIGCEHWVSTQRDDRTNGDRSLKPQTAPVNHMMEADFQSIINISKVRLCHCASPETRQAWILMLNELAKLEPELVSACVPSCVYRGFCAESFGSCGYSKTPAFESRKNRYRNMLTS